MSVQVRNSTGVDYNVTEGPGTGRGIVIRDSLNVDRACQIGHVRDSSNVDRVFFNRQKTILPGTTLAKRGSYLSEVSSTSSTFSLICRDTPNANGQSAAVYTYADVTNFNTLCMDIIVNHAHAYASALVGIGNFDTFNYNTYENYPVISNGWGMGSGIRPGFPSNVITGAQTTTVQFRLDISSLSGNKCIGVCVVSRSSHDATMHVSCSKIWME